MWILSHSKGKSLCLLPGKQYVIGRKSADLVLEGDQSVSRKHAIVSVSANKGLDISTPPSTLKLVDESSKYGTFVKTSDHWDKLSHTEERVLVDKDTIRFGLLENEWRVMYVPLIVTTSNLNNEEKRRLQNALLNIDGYMTKTWGSTLTHLTMKSITLTVKAICAMACGKPIVTPEYWTAYLEMAANNKELPDSNAFIPPLGEPSIDANSVSFGVNDERQSVLRGKHFVFASRLDLQELECMVTAAGGTADAFDKYVNSLDRLCMPDVILVNCSFITSRSAPTQQVHLVEPFNKAKRYLESRGRRVIADQEIGNAILYCSTEEYCNPLRNVNDAVSSSSNMSQVQPGSRVSLDFTSQVVDRPTQEVESPPRILHPLVEPVVQRATSLVDLHSNDSTFAYTATQASCASSRDIFASPVKVERTNEKETNKACDNRTRIRTPELDGAPEPKRPALVNNMPSRNIPIKMETEDLFSFATSNPRPKRTRLDNDTEEEDEFTFTNETKPKQERCTGFNESSCDLFGSVPSMPVASNRTHQVVDGTDTPRAKVPPALRNSPEPAAVPQKRKKPFHDEHVLPPSKKTKNSPASETMSRTASSVTSNLPVSLKGFIDMSYVENDHHKMDDLADRVKDIFIIEKKVLVVRERSRLASSLNGSGTVINFKRFKKVWPINRRILPRIIGGKDLHPCKVGAENKGDDTLDNGREDANLEKVKEKEKDEWDFPTPGQSVNTSSRRRKSRK